MKEVITNAEKKEFSKFADKVRTSLDDKLRNNPVLKSKEDELKQYNNMKDIFAQISKEETPPEENEQD